MAQLLFKELNQLIGDYADESIMIAPGLSFNQYETLKMIEFYSNSEYLNGDKDELGRDKPFFNIVNANVDVSVVATDLDTKDIQIQGTDKDSFIKAFLLSKAAKAWMRETNYAKHLNERNETRARYGGVVIKKTESAGKLKIDVVPWKNLITDPVDLVGGIIVEKHYMSPSELSKKQGVWDNVKDAMKLATTKRATTKGAESEATDKRVPIYEIHGEFPVAVYKECMGEAAEQDDYYNYERYIFIVAGDSERPQVVLWSDIEKENPYKYLPWKIVHGRALGKGVVEEGEQAQIWANDSIISEKNVMELAGKVMVQTSSKRYAGRNIFTEVDNGTIFEVEDGRPLQRVEVTPNSLPVYQNLIQRWQSQYDRSAAITDALRGETPPSGQAFRLAALVTQQSSSQFDYRREEAGIFEKEVWTDWIIPHLIKKLSKKQTLALEFDNNELFKIDDAFINHLVAKEIVKQNRRGFYVPPEEIETTKENIRQQLITTGQHRFIEVPDGFFKDVTLKVDVITTGEQKNKSAMLESMSTIFQQVSSSYNPQTGQFMILEDPVLAEIFYQMVEAAGTPISPVTIATRNQKQATMGQPTPMAPELEGQEQGPAASPEGELLGTQGLPNPIEAAPEAMQAEAGV